MTDDLNLSLWVARRAEQGTLQAHSDYVVREIAEYEAKLAKAQSVLKRIAETKPHFAGATPNEHFMRTWAKEALA